MSENVFFCGAERARCSYHDIPVLSFRSMPTKFVSCSDLLESKGIILGAKSYIAKFGLVPTINGYYFFEEYASRYVWAMKCECLESFIEVVLEEQKNYIEMWEKKYNEAQ